MNDGPVQLEDAATLSKEKRRGPRRRRLRPLLIDAVGFAELIGSTEAFVRKLDASGRCPAPIQLGRLLRWKYSELVAWTEAGCPPRSKWAAMQYARQRGKELEALKK